MAEKPEYSAVIEHGKKIMAAVDLREHKRLGRSVKGFDHAICINERLNIALTDNHVICTEPGNAETSPEHRGHTDQ